MSQPTIILFGEKNSKRTTYFCKAAQEHNLTVTLLSHENWKKAELQGGFIKIDPPSYNTYDILSIKQSFSNYKTQLLQIEQAANERGIPFLNTPSAIIHALDKNSCKYALMKQHLPVTRLLCSHLNSMEQLIDLMRKMHIYSVFLKPVHGSGAGGIIALSMNPNTEKLSAYTAMHSVEGGLFQSKRIRKLTDYRDAAILVNTLCSLDVMVEQWHPKAQIDRNYFDFRVLWQFGSIDHIVVRASSMPMTNLHLNNCAIPFDKLFESGLLGKKETFLNSLNDLCFKAINNLDGLNIAGFDIMLDKKTLLPRIIEVNGQGDLLYSDIYDKNEIYGKQAEYIRQKTTEL